MVNDEKIPIAVKTENGYVGLKYKFDTYLKKILVNDYIDEYNQEPYIVTSGGIYGDNEEYIEGSTKGLYQETFNKMVESVEKNKGFYISRYEVGNLTNAVKNLLVALEYTNGILARHQAMLEDICKITGITIENIKKELKNA